MVIGVSELAKRAGISPHTVRYYGRRGLLPESGRTGGGHRFYDDEALERLRFIKGAQEFDLSLDEIASLLELCEGSTCRCGQTRDVLRQRIAAIDEQQAHLARMRATLCRLLGEDATTVASLSEADGDCGCCQPPPESRRREIDELRARRAAVERRLSALGPMSHSAPAVEWA